MERNVVRWLAVAVFALNPAAARFLASHAGPRVIGICYMRTG